MQAFMQDFDGRGVTALEFDGASDERWLIRGDAIDVAGLRRAAQSARERGEPLLVLATSLALDGRFTGERRNLDGGAISGFVLANITTTTSLPAGAIAGSEITSRTTPSAIFGSSLTPRRWSRFSLDADETSLH